MSYKRSSPYASFSDLAINRRTRKSKFFTAINTIIDWNALSESIDRVYSRGKSKKGQAAYPGLLLFKMLLIGTWHDLSDMDVEDMVNENLSAMVFCGLKLEDDVPDHSVLSRFRSELSRKGAFDELLSLLNQQLKAKGVMVAKGKAKVDATLTDSPRRPKGKKSYRVAQDREEDDRSESDKTQEHQTHRLIAEEQPSVDHQGRWVKKRGKLHYGYKQHIAVDDDGMIEGVHTTAANEHDSKGLDATLSKVPKEKKQEVLADKGYKSKANDEVVAKHQSKNRIQDKAYRNKPLTSWQKKRNKLISKQRYKVERTFGSMKKWFKTGTCHYIGLEKTHAQHVLEAIAHNLKRSPGLVWEKCVQ